MRLSILSNSLTVARRHSAVFQCLHSTRANPSQAISPTSESRQCRITILSPSSSSSSLSLSWPCPSGSARRAASLGRTAAFPARGGRGQVRPPTAPAVVLPALVAAAATPSFTWTPKGIPFRGRRRRRRLEYQGMGGMGFPGGPPGGPGMGMPPGMGRGDLGNMQFVG